MNISITRLILLVAGFALIIAGVVFGIDAMRTKDWVQGIFCVAGIAVGFALVSGKGINISQ